VSFETADLVMIRWDYPVTLELNETLESVQQADVHVTAEKQGPATSRTGSNKAILVMKPARGGRNCPVLCCVAQALVSNALTSSRLPSVLHTVH
jgi:hypothetical protein